MSQKDLWVYISHSENSPDAQSLALLAKSQQLAADNNMELSCVVAGNGATVVANKLADMGVPITYCADVADMNACEYLRVTGILEPFIKERSPEIVLFPATDSASLVASSLGVRLNTGVNVHCVTADIRDGIFIGAVPAFGGQVMSEILCPVKKPQMATVRLSGGEFQVGSKGRVVAIADTAPNVPGLRLVSVEKEETNGISLSEAEVVLCAGAGVEDAEGLELLKQLAERMNAGVCCTRNLLDMGCGADESSLVGVSGITIAPKVYVGFGVSGSAHHLCGLGDSGLILNVNKDKANPFFAASDCGYVGDTKAVIAEMLKLLA